MVDGIVSNQTACTFNPAVLRCASGDADTCLTDAQIATANTIYSELKRADGTSVYPGWGPGGEDLGWPVWVTGTAVGGTGLQFQFDPHVVSGEVTNVYQMRHLAAEDDVADALDELRFVDGVRDAGDVDDLAAA